MMQEYECWEAGNMNEQEQILYMQARLSRMASERWGKTLAEVMNILSKA